MTKPQPMKYVPPNRFLDLAGARRRGLRIPVGTKFALREASRGYKTGDIFTVTRDDGTTCPWSTGPNGETVALGLTRFSEVKEAVQIVKGPMPAAAYKAKPASASARQDFSKLALLISNLRACNPNSSNIRDVYNMAVEVGIIPVVKTPYYWKAETPEGYSTVSFYLAKHFAGYMEDGQAIGKALATAYPEWKVYVTASPGEKSLGTDKVRLWTDAMLQDIPAIIRKMAA